MKLAYIKWVTYSVKLRTASSSVQNNKELILLCTQFL